MPSTVRPLLVPTTPALAAAMASWLGMPCRATADVQKAMEPPPVRIMLFTAGRRMLKQEYRLTRITWGVGWGGGGGRRRGSTGMPMRMQERVPNKWGWRCRKGHWRDRQAGTRVRYAGVTQTQHQDQAGLLH